ncbi:MAG: hypothetical protein WCJ06_02035 [Planctomycetota bacterium]
MLKPWLKSFKNIFKNTSTDKFLKKPKNRRTALELLSLEERLNLSTVLVSYDSTLGVLTLNSEADALGADSSYTAIQSTGVDDNLLNFSATPGDSVTFFKSVAPLVFVNPLSSGSQSVQVDTRNLAGFSKIVFQGSEGNNNLVLGSIDGNVIGDTASPDFSFEVDVFSTNGGFSGGTDLLQIDGVISIKGDGDFTTDSLVSAMPNSNLESLIFGSSAGILSNGSGGVRLVADGFASSNIEMIAGSFLNIGSGDVYLRSGTTGNIILNGNAITTIGGSVDLETNVVLQSTTSISTGLGDSNTNIDFKGTIQGVSGSGQDLNLDTTGTITITGDAGDINLPLGTIRIGSNSPSGVRSFVFNDLYAKSLNSVTFGAFQSNGVIVVNYIDGLNITTNDSTLGTITLGSNSLIGSSITTLNNGSVNINNAGLLEIYGGLSLDGAFNQTGSGLVSLGFSSNNIFSVTTTSDSISFTSPITLNQAQNISSNASGVLGGGANISFGSTLDGFFPLTLAAGIGNINFSNKIGSSIALSSILVSNVNKLNALRSINAESLTIIQANNSVSFTNFTGDSDSYSDKTGLSINTFGPQGTVNFYKPVKCFNNAIINVNSSGFLNLYSGANLSVEAGSMVLGGSGGGGINLFSNVSSTNKVGTGSITFTNPVTLLADVTVSTTDGGVLFANTINSNPSATLRSLTLQDTLNQGIFSFAKSVGLTTPLNIITVKSSGGVSFSSTVNANAITIEDSKNTIEFKGNLTLSGDLQTQNVSDIYNLSLTGLTNQISGAGIFANTGLITLGNSNSSSFLFNGGISESGLGGVVAQGSFVASGAVSFASNFKVNGNNVGIVTLDLGSDSVFNGLVDVQANERINKNGIGTLRLITNTGSSFKGTMVVNQGSVIFSSDFSSMDNLTISGGTVSGAGSVGKVYGLAGTVTPGDTVGTLTTGNFSLNALMTLSLQVGTTSNGVNDLVLVNGTVSLSNATLSVTTGNFITLGTTYTIIQNDGTDVVNGTFLNLPEGSSYTSGNTIFTISYKGGSGNDVTLKVISTVLPPTPVNVPGVKQTFATGIDAGGGPLVTVNYSDGHTSSFFAYDQNFRGGVRVAMGDINGDGNVDLVTAPGVGGGPNIKIFNLVSGTPIQVADFFVFEAAFFGGLYIGVGNLNNDGFGDIIVGAGPGGGPRVSAYAGSQNFSISGSTVMTTFFAYAPEFTGGITVAAADRTGDGLDEIVTGAGFGGGPNVTVFQLQQTPQGAFNQVVIQNFFAFDTLFTGGIYVAGGRFTNSTYDDIFVGTGPGTKATVAVAFGTGGIHYLNPFGNFNGGVRVGISSSTIKGTTPNYLMAAAGPGGGPQVSLYNSNFNQVDSFFATNPNVTLGLFANSTIL